MTAPEVSEGRKGCGSSGFVGNIFMEMSQAARCLLRKGPWIIPRVFMGGFDGFNKVGIVKVKSGEIKFPDERFPAAFYSSQSSGMKFYGCKQVRKQT